MDRVLRRVQVKMRLCIIVLTPILSSLVDMYNVRFLVARFWSRGTVWDNHNDIILASFIPDIAFGILFPNSSYSPIPCLCATQNIMSIPNEALQKVLLVYRVAS